MQLLQTRTENWQVKSLLGSLTRFRLTSTIMTHSDAVNASLEVAA